MNKLVVEKLWSLNPKKFKTISLTKAKKDYKKYVSNDKKYWGKPHGVKSFSCWLGTEI